MGLGVGTSLGATVGSVIPGVGTAIGGTLGGVYDAISGLFGGGSKVNIEDELNKGVQWYVNWAKSKRNFTLNTQTAYSLLKPVYYGNMPTSQRTKVINDYINSVNSQTSNSVINIPRTGSGSNYLNQTKGFLSNPIIIAAAVAGFYFLSKK